MKRNAIRNLIAYSAVALATGMAWADNVAKGTVTLGAKPEKNCVFAGWYDENDKPLAGAVDYRTPSYTCVASEGVAKMTARFAMVEEDIASLKVDVDDMETGKDGSVTLDLGACVESLSLPKIAVSGLPAGLKYDAKTLKVSGKATKPGVYAVKVSATNTSVKKALVKEFRITVPNLSCDALPNLKPAVDAYGILTAGVAMSADLVDCTPTSGWTMKVSGLPSGLKYDAKTGKIAGVPTAKAGSYTVTFTASKGKESQVATITLNVEPLPNWAVGTFSGDGDYWENLWNLGYDGYDFVHTVTVGANGKVSGSIMVDITSGKQDKAAFSVPELAGYLPNVHLVCWEDTYDGPAYYCDVDIAIDGKKKTRRLYICDLGAGTFTDEEHEELPKYPGVGLAVFADAEFKGEAWQNLLTNKAYTGPIPKFASSTVTKTVTTDDGDECTFTFKQNGSVAAKIKRSNGKGDSAAFTLAVFPKDGGAWFLAAGNWIFPKGSIADVEFRMTPNEKGVITADDIEVTDIDVDIDDELL